ncbi:MAG TPA: hypothetical protein VG753_02080 [Candidatus Paceibacterota bacterium]|nr:hypothetical protein [Candidatus Paceibacterota bacterium]
MRRAGDDLEADFNRARLNHGVPALDFVEACEMLDELEQRLKQNNHEDFEEKMEFILDIHMQYDRERSAYKSFFSLVIWRRRRAREEEMNEREFAPLDEDGIQY